MQIWHVTFSSVRRRTLFPDERSRRRAVWIVVRIAGDALLLFCVVDDHFHTVVICEAHRLPFLRGAIVQALTRASGEQVTSHARPIESRAHLNRTLAYLLQQTDHHGIEAHPATWSGSCFQDLVGARRISSLAARVAKELPRLRTDDLCRMVGLPRGSLVPADRETVRRAGVSRLVEASAAAFAAGPELADRSTPTVLARRTTAHLGNAVGISRADLAWALDITPQRIGQLATEPIDPACLRAARLQIVVHDLAQVHREQPTAP